MAFGDPMTQKTITWGLALSAFVVTLAISSWREGLWHSGEQTAMASASPGSDATHIPARPFEKVASSGPTPVRPAPLAPAVPVATRPMMVAAAPPPPPPAPPPVAESAPAPAPADSATDDTPSPVPDPDEEQVRQQAERSAERGARSH